MPQSLAEYASWLDSRRLLWPEVPPAEPLKATPFTRPLAGIRAVTFEVYGTLLRITGGRLLLEGPDKLSLQIALEKTIEEFNVWNFLFRKPGPAWKQVLEQYEKLIAGRRMAAVARQGDLPEVDAAADVWRKLIEQWDRKEFKYDEQSLGDRDALAQKIAYYFHACLQGIESAPGAGQTVERISSAGFVVGLLTDAQCFTALQLRRMMADSGQPVGIEAIDQSASVFSFQEGLRKPSPSLFRRSIERFRERGIEPAEILHVSSRLKDDLAVARRHGMRTALYAGDSESLIATKSEVRDPALAPDRLITGLGQLADVLGIG